MHMGMHRQGFPDRHNIGCLSNISCFLFPVNQTPGKERTCDLHMDVFPASRHAQIGCGYIYSFTSN